MLTFDFTGKTAIVTGGTRGIGAAVTRRLLETGATVHAVFAGNQQAADDFAAALPDTLRPRLHTVRLDVSDYSACEQLFAQLSDTPLDIVVNCAGIRRDAVTAMMTRDNWQSVIDVNLSGTFNMTKLAILAMMRQRHGRIINLTSPSGKLGFEGQANYAASKAGIVALTKSAARETARRNITVNAVSPGFIDTDFIAALSPEQIAKYRADVPLRRFGKPAEVADAILFLASDEAAYITGSVLEITGGL